jgi:cytochrome c6
LNTRARWELVMVGLLALMAPASEAADVNKGAQLYARHCASCHGKSGVPEMAGLPNFTQPATMMRSDAAIATVIRNGKMSMPGYRGLLKESEVYDVIAYLRTLLR